MEFIAKKEGFLYDKEWVYDEEKEEGEYVITLIDPLSETIDQLIFELNTSVTIDEGFTVRDWFKLVINYPILQTLDWFMESYIEEYKKCPETGCVDPDGKVHTIVIKKIIEISNYGDDIKKFDCEIFNDIYGDSKDVHYGIEGWDLKNFLDIPLKISTGVFVKEIWNGKRKEESIIEHNSEDINVQYTLFDFIKSFIYELSWFGTPKQRDERMEEMNDTMRKIKSGELETIPYDPDDFFEEKEDKDDTGTSN